jgi:hypothetical protein
MPEATSYAQLCDRAEALLDRWKTRRDAQTQPVKAAIDGVAHALDSGSMDAAIPARRLLFLDLEGPEPLAAVAVGDLDTATHVTFQLSGAGIRARTAMWGTAREAGQLAIEQAAAGAQRPAVVAWLGYPAPGLVRALVNGTARTAVERLAFELQRFARLRPDAPHTAIEAHSYGATLAAHTLARLAGRPTASVRAPRIDALATTGSAGMPRALAIHPERLGVETHRIFEGVARSDWLARWGRTLSGRLLVPGRPFAVDGNPELGLFPVTGHNTSRFVPSAARPSYGYRDPGTLSLHNLARITTGADPVGS